MPIKAVIVFSLLSVALADIAGTLAIGIHKDRSFSNRSHCNVLLREMYSNSNSSVVPVSLVNGFLSYYATLYLGSDRQEVAPLIDTGSGDLWVVSASNPYCWDGSHNCAFNSFDTSSSSTFQNLSQPWDISYLDGTYASGFLSRDDIELGEAILSAGYFATADVASSVESVFGVGLPGSEATITYYSNGDQGGFAYPNVPQMLKQEGIIERNAYSLYLNGAFAAEGTILFGGVDHSRYSGQLGLVPLVNVYAPVINKNVVFTVMLSGINLHTDDKSCPLVGMNIPVSLDSGSSYGILPEEVVTDMATAMNYTAYSDDIEAYHGSCDPSKFRFDTFELDFSGIKLQVPPATLLDHAVQSDGSPVTVNGESQCILAIGTGDSITQMILGDVFLRNFYVVYDLDSEQIALAQSRNGIYEPEDIEVIRKSVPSASTAPRYFSTEFNTTYATYNDLGQCWTTKTDYYKTSAVTANLDSTSTDSETTSDFSTSYQSSVTASPTRTGAENIMTATSISGNALSSSPDLSSPIPGSAASTESNSSSGNNGSSSSKTKSSIATSVSHPTESSISLSSSESTAFSSPESRRSLVSSVPQITESSLALSSLRNGGYSGTEPSRSVATSVSSTPESSSSSSSTAEGGRSRAGGNSSSRSSYPPRRSFVPSSSSISAWYTNSSSSESFSISVPTSSFEPESSTAVTAATHTKQGTIALASSSDTSSSGPIWSSSDGASPTDKTVSSQSASPESTNANPQSSESYNYSSKEALSSHGSSRSVDIHSKNDLSTYSSSLTAQTSEGNKAQSSGPASKNQSTSEQHYSSIAATIIPKQSSVKKSESSKIKVKSSPTPQPSSEGPPPNTKSAVTDSHDSKSPSITEIGTTSASQETHSERSNNSGHAVNGVTTATKELTTYKTIPCSTPTTVTYNSKIYTVTEPTTLTVEDCMCTETPATISLPMPEATSVITMTEVVPSFVTTCSSPTSIVQNGKTYTVTGSTVLTITDCPCTVTQTTGFTAKPISGTTRPRVPVTTPSESKTLGSGSQTTIDIASTNSVKTAPSLANGAVGRVNSSLMGLLALLAIV